MLIASSIHLGMRFVGTRPEHCLLETWAARLSESLNLTQALIFQTSKA